MRFDRTRGILRSGPDSPDFDPEYPEASDVIIVLRRDPSGQYEGRVRGLRLGKVLYRRDSFGVVTRMVRSDGDESLKVVRVLPGSTAASAGLLGGDIITHVAGLPASRATVERVTLEHDFGELIRFEVLRGGERLDLGVRLGSRALR